MYEGYMLEWLDNLIMQSLNPAKTDFTAVQLTKGPKLAARINEEMFKIQHFLKAIIFNLRDERKIKTFVKLYYSTLLLLMDQARKNDLQCPDDLPELKQLSNKLVSCVDELLFFLVLRFGNYLGPTDRASAPYLVPPISLDKIPNKTIEGKKVLCNLSVDQMAILLRCLDDLKIVVASSLTAIFKSIVPYLSTPYKENLSHDSMRSKTYAIETRDKELVIQTLEQMIKKIMEY